MEETYLKTMRAILGLITLVETMVANCEALDRMSGGGRHTTTYRAVAQKLADSITQFQVQKHDLEVAEKNGNLNEWSVKQIGKAAVKAKAGTKYIGQVFNVPTYQMSAQNLLSHIG